jgi:3-hydroxybutyryl-CoA dehydrogenase
VTPIRTITVVGAGPEGRRLAAQASRAGYRSILEDLSGHWARKVAMPGVEVVTDLEWAAGEADLVVEFAPDDFETKFEVYTLLDRAARPAAIFASTSRAWPVDEVASLTYRAAQVLGLAPESLVLTPGVETSPETLQAVAEVTRSLSTWSAKT